MVAKCATATTIRTYTEQETAIGRPVIAFNVCSIQLVGIVKCVSQGSMEMLFDKTAGIVDAMCLALIRTQVRATIIPDNARVCRTSLDNSVIPVKSIIGGLPADKAAILASATQLEVFQTGSLVKVSKTLSKTRSSFLL